MVEPSSQDIHPIANQTPQNAFGQPFPQPSAHPMGMGGNYTPPSFASPPPPMPPQKILKNNKTIITIGNFSLFGIVSSLVFLGAFTFLGGFLLGMWLGSPTPAPYSFGQRNVPLSQQSIPLPSNFSQSQKPKEVHADKASEKNKAADMIGDAAKDAVSGIPMPDTPDFLTPLISATQDAVAKQAADRAQKATEQAQQIISPSSSEAPAEHPQASPPSATPSLSPASSLLQENEGAYSIQLGVYAAKENADALKNTLQALNYTTYITEGKSTEGNMLYYVYSGRYKSYTKASDMASQFAAQNIPGAVVVKLSKSGKDNP